MDAKIQELTEKIFREGVEKGNEQANKLISEAEAKSAEIISKAQSEAENIVNDAKKKSAELHKNTSSELQLYAGQTIESLKSTIVDAIAGEIVTSNVKAASNDPAFMQKLMLEMTKNWASGEDLIISTPNAEALKNYFMSNAKELLDNKVSIKNVNGQANSFTITPKDGSYKIVFGDEEFISLFKSFLRPKLVEMLF